MSLLVTALTTLMETGMLVEVEAKRRDSRIFERVKHSDPFATVATVATVGDTSQREAVHDDATDCYGSATDCFSEAWRIVVLVTHVAIVRHAAV